jgi:hypothetical protein
VLLVDSVTLLSSVNGLVNKRQIAKRNMSDHKTKMCVSCTNIYVLGNPGSHVKKSEKM